MSKKLTTTPKTQLDECLAGITNFAGASLRGFIGIGVYCHKANAIFNIQGKRTDLEPVATVATGEPAPNEGFVQWIREEITERFGFSQRTIYNYMNAAKSVGFSAETTEEEVLALDIAGKKATDLYKLGNPPPPDPPAPKPPVSPHEAATQIWLPLFEDLGDYAAPESTHAKALWQLPLVSADATKPSLAALELKLKSALDLISEVKSQRSSKQ